MVLGPSFKNDQRTGNLQSLITDGVESLEAFLTQYIPQIVVVAFTTIFITTFMCRLDRTVGLLLLFMSALTVIVPHIFMPAVSDVMVLYWKEYAQLNAQYIDDMQGMSTLKSLGVSKKEGKSLKTQAIGFAAESASTKKSRHWKFCIRNMTCSTISSVFLECRGDKTGIRI